MLLSFSFNFVEQNLGPNSNQSLIPCQCCFSFSKNIQNILLFINYFRLSAVFGGIYALKQPIVGFTVIENQFKSVIVDNQTISADHLIMSMEYCPEMFIHSVNKKYISRGVLITERSVMKSEKEHLTLLVYPPENGKPGVTIIELGTLTGTSPKDLCMIQKVVNFIYTMTCSLFLDVVHLISRQQENPEADFSHIVKNLFLMSSTKDEFNNEKPKILCSFYFSLPDSNELNVENIPKNVFLCPGPDLDLDYDISIKKVGTIQYHVFTISPSVLYAIIII